MEKSNNKYLHFAVFMILSAVAARLCIGLLYFNAYDTFWYRSWAFGLQEGLFDIYARAEEISLDYPPAYLFCLWLTGLFYRIVGNDCGQYLQMFTMKFWPIFFDALCCAMIYKASRRHGEWTALCATFCWAANPSVIFNTSFWGQTDQLMALLLLLSFYLAERERPVWACAAFALAGLTKYQSLFFTPVLLLYIFRKHGLKPLIKGIGTAAATVAGMFLPFMIGARDPWLFFRVYLGGVGTYKFCTFNAYNIYGALGLNVTPDNTQVFGPITYNHINVVVILLTVAAVAYFYLRGKRVNIYIGGFFIMQTLFMFSIRMHERYQMVVLIFALMAFVTTKNRHFLRQFSILTVLTLVNQAVILFEVNSGNIFYAPYMGEIMQVCSVVNLAAYFYTAYSCIQYFFKKEEIK